MEGEGEGNDGEVIKPFEEAAEVEAAGGGWIESCESIRGVCDCGEGRRGVVGDEEGGDAVRR